MAQVRLVLLVLISFAMLHGAVLEAVAVVTGLDDMAMVRESIQ